jgi:hypothetical protein
MIRTQIYLPEEIHIKLSRQAQKRKEPMARLVREYVEEGLLRDERGIQKNTQGLLDLAKLAQDIAKNYPGPPPPRDLAENHNKYLAEALEADLERIHKQYDDTH